MTKKHYEAIAQILASYKNTPLYEVDYSDYKTNARIASDMADYFATDNPKFNRTRFLQACGVKCDGRHNTVNDIVKCHDCAESLDNM